MADFRPLIRFHRWQLDEKRRAMAELQALRDRLNQELVRLEEELVQEQEAARGDLNASFAYASYATTVIARRQRLQQSIEQVDQQLAAANDEIAAAFQELKKYELAQAERDRRSREKMRRRESAAMDETALTIHRRREG